MKSAILNLYLVTRLEDGASLAAGIGNLAVTGLGCQHLIDRVALCIGKLDNLSALLEQQSV